MARATPERVLRVRLLLDEQAERWSYGRRERHLTGDAPAAWWDCPDCRGTGRQGACSRCDGRGLVLVDEYTAGYDLQTRRLGEERKRETMTDYEIDAALRRLAEDAADRGELGASYDDRPEPSSTVELHRVLRHMRDGGSSALRQCYDAIRVVHWPVLPVDHPERVRVLEEIGCHWLAVKMRGSIRLAAPLEESVVVLRRGWIRERAREGFSVPEIARDLGLDRRSVRRALEEDRAA